MKPLSLPLALLRICFRLDASVPSGLRWAKSGKPAGQLKGDHDGRFYWTVTLNYRAYRAHRIVWALTHGRDPGLMFIDHRNGDTTDNRPRNLRVCSNAENLRNRDKNKNNKSGVKGVSWDAQHKGWRAQIQHHGKKLNLGNYATISEAASVYQGKARELFGKFEFRRSRQLTRTASRVS
jgi:hypothetical protein